MENREYVLTRFKKFDKIIGSEYFMSLLFSILEGQTEEEEINQILSYEFPVSPEYALEILEEMHRKWMENEIELELVYNCNSENEGLLQIIEKKIKEKQKIK